MSNKYYKFESYLKAYEKDDLILSFEELENILGFSLPNSAYEHEAYLSNGDSHPIPAIFLSFGFKNIEPDSYLKKYLHLRRSEKPYERKVKEFNSKTSSLNFKHKTFECIYPNDLKDDSPFYAKEIINLILNVSKSGGKTIDGKELNENSFFMIHQFKNHDPIALPKGKMAVYTFVYNGKFLKIGKVNSNSNARYQYQHYHPESANSNLAKSIINDNSFNEVDKEHIGEWIKKNCERFDVILDESLGSMVLDFIEGLLHFKYNPKYEG